MLTLRNKYVTLRHGQSSANVTRLVASAPNTGVPRYGLTPHGINQVESSAQTYLQHNPPPEYVYSSDFSRARHTAQLAVAAGMGNGLVRVAYELRERHFGAFEESAADCYLQVWERDRIDEHHSWQNVEPVAHVVTRMWQLIHRLEAHHHHATILLVGHADPLKILHASYQGLNPGTHHQALPLMDNTEFWPLNADEWARGGTAH